ncbi:hypothetical protein FQR65_LT15414 [Abscondita terminalis]|nr:hypothetical protein FQR65_LT15414 [Abscondita terminalis]
MEESLTRTPTSEETDKLWQDIKSNCIRFYMEDLGLELGDPMFPTTDKQSSNCTAQESRSWTFSSSTMEESLTRTPTSEETDKLWQNIKSKRVRFYMEDLGPELVDPMFPTTGQFSNRRDAIRKAKEHAAEKQARKAAAEQAKKDRVDQIPTAQDPGISDEDFEDILRLP